MKTNSSKSFLDLLQGADSPFRSRPALVVIQLLLKIVPMFLRGLWWKIWLKSSGKITLIGKQVTIHNPQYIRVGNQFVAEDFSEIQGLSKQGIEIGEHVTIGRFAMIRPSGYYGRESGEGLKVGSYSNIGPYCYIGCSGKIEIGEHVLMSPRVSMFAENHVFDRTDVPMRDQGVIRQEIIVENDCWLASGSIILAGVRIGKGAIVAAGAVVTKDVPSYAVVGGSPARILRWRKPEEPLPVEALALPQI
jgi:acetyltransferase-like isoleucine patch superfamily enzyme